MEALQRAVMPRRRFVGWFSSARLIEGGRTEQTGGRRTYRKRIPARPAFPRYDPSSSVLYNMAPKKAARPPRAAALSWTLTELAAPVYMAGAVPVGATVPLPMTVEVAVA